MSDTSMTSERSFAADKALAVVLAVLGFAALTTQLYLFVVTQITEGNSAAWGLVLYFGYFTILTNLFCAIVATAVAKSPAAESRWQAWRQPWVVTAAAMAILMVGVIFHLLLSAQYQPTGISAITNIIHHYVVPTGFTILWWRVVARGSLEWSDVPRIVAYPFAYMVYILFRGEVTGLYPYFFIDVPQIGYAQTLRNAAGIGLAFLAASAAFVAVKR